VTGPGPLFAKTKAPAQGEPKDDLVLHTDGAARGNPGPAGAGAVLLDQKGREVATFKRYLGNATNNVAEYEALILGLTGALDLGVSTLTVKLDSELLVRQLSGAYRVKSPLLKPLHQKALALLRGFARAEVLHVPREKNRKADQLANQAIDRAG